ncbi:hypothetical protein AAG565_03995 [Fontimonas sp. SYSU GA230001]|uniref:hypothetical protein n=1 Tax=Fontimonas sp. SYSU GA230001 TaxID=3142450 RepID=UPI0032B3C386
MIGRRLLVAASLSVPAFASAQTDEPEQLDPVIVEGQPSELDSLKAVYSGQLPCIGDCADADEQDDPVARVLRGVRSLFIAAHLPERPRPQDSLGLVNPTQTRLDQKRP